MYSSELFIFMEYKQIVKIYIYIYILDCLVKNKMKQELPAWPITINPKFNMYKFNMYIFYKKKCLHYVKMQ